MTKGQDTLNKGKIHVPGGMEWDGVPFKTCELFISGVFHLMFLTCDGPQVI